MDDLTHVRSLLLDEPDPATIYGPSPSLGERDLLAEKIIGSRRAAAPPPRRLLNRRILALAAATVAIAALVAATIVAPLREQPALAALPIRHAVITAAPPPAHTTPQSVLLQAANASQRQHAALGPVRYRRVMAGYLHIVGGNRPAATLAPETVETWWAPDGSWVVRHEGAAPIWASQSDHDAWQATGAPTPDTTRTDHFSTADPDASRYSTDPTVLARQLSAEIPPTRPDRAARMLARLRDIRLADTSPALESATYKVAATLPGLRVFGTVQDQLGRTGVAVGLDSSYSGKRTRYELIFGADGRLLEYQEILLQPVPYLQARPPIQIAFEIEVTRGAVAAIGDRPAE